MKAFPLTPEEQLWFDAYLPRVSYLREVANALQMETFSAIKNVEHVDRVCFRTKEPDSFARKAAKRTSENTAKYLYPLEEIEDQIAGRILVFFRRDILAVVKSIHAAFSRVEQETKAPSDARAFAYESEHVVLQIPPQVKSPGFLALKCPPLTFELQIRTLFMHAYAEPEHDISYKAEVPLDDDERRKLAWAAANAWGGDSIFEQVLDSLAARSTDANG